MKISDVYKKLHEFVAAATGYPQEKVIFANQSSTRPRKPFITIDVRDFQAIGSPVKKDIDDQGIETIVVTTTFTVTFQAFGDKLHEAEDILSLLHIKFDTQLPLTVFKQEMSLLRTLKNVTALPKEMNAQFESRAFFDARMCYNKVITDNVGFIDSIEVINTLNNNEKIEVKKNG